MSTSYLWPHSNKPAALCICLRQFTEVKLKSVKFCRDASSQIYFLMPKRSHRFLLRKHVASRTCLPNANNTFFKSGTWEAVFALLYLTHWWDKLTNMCWLKSPLTRLFVHWKISWHLVMCTVYFPKQSVDTHECFSWCIGHKCPVKHFYLKYFPSYFRLRYSVNKKTYTQTHQL